MMVGERWDLHLEQRGWERWAGLNRHPPVLDEEEDDERYADMVRELVEETD